MKTQKADQEGDKKNNASADSSSSGNYRHSLFQYADDRGDAGNTQDTSQLKGISISDAHSAQLQSIADSSPQVQYAAQLQSIANNSPQAQQAAQLQSIADGTSQQQEAPKKKNKTGLPDELKTNIESLSGISLDDVKVHYNSKKPAQLSAHAYAQGKDIFLSSGQEKHLAHEAWHIVQQKQGRVKPTTQTEDGVNINDDQGLEKEADMMGKKAVEMSGGAKDVEKKVLSSGNAIQKKSINEGVAQFALPATLAEWRTLNNDEINANAEKSSDQDLFANLHYISNFVIPFLMVRLDYVESNLDYGKERRKLAIKKMKEAKQLYNRALNSIDPRKYEDIREKYKTFDINFLIRFSNALPTTMENISTILGGYEADKGKSGDMPDLAKKLNHIARGVGDEEADVLDPATAATVAKATKAVSRLSKSKFMSNKTIPVELQRLVMDIYLHWKSRKIMDTRTQTQKDEQAKTPDQAGALRTYHMNEHATIPALPKDYEGDHPIHEHYVSNSQGSSVHGGVPYGFAEYTGIDSDQNKIVLDYVNGNIYITSTHYKHWFDNGEPIIPLSGDVEESRRAIGGSKTEGNLQSPWVKIEMN